MKKSDFYFDCPQELIADYPYPERSTSRLLHVPAVGEFADRRFTDLVELLGAGDLLIINDTRVIPARLFGHKQSGGKIEILVERILTTTLALAYIRASKSPRDGALLQVKDVYLRVTGRKENLFVLELLGQAEFPQLLNQYGHIPLPAYIHRAAEEMDGERYQTVYARHSGSVAAPTAGLHFDDKLLTALRDKGVVIETLTLHVGAGTFQPIKTERIDDHVMHSEQVIVSEQLCDAVFQCRHRRGRIIAVGSTVLRALETAADSDGMLRPFTGETNLFIQPGYQFKIPDAMITNFHLSESTLLILVCALAGRERMLAAYRHAVAQRYRFFSYGDATYIERNDAIQD